MIPGTTEPQPGPRKPPPWYPPPPLGPTGPRSPTFGEVPRLNIFCASAQSADASVTAAVRQSRKVRCVRMIPSSDSILSRLFGCGDKADDLVLLQLLHDIGELALGNSGYRNADFVQSARHRSGGDREFVCLKKFGDVV